MRRFISVLIALALTCTSAIAFAEDNYQVLSVGKPITSIYYGDGGYNNTTPARANDGNTSTIFYSNAGTDNADGLIIDLQKNYYIAYAEIEISGTAFDYTISASTSSDFETEYTFVNTDGKCAPSASDAKVKMRYVKLSVPATVAKFRIKEFTVYGTGNTAEGGVKTASLPVYASTLVPVSQGKEATSKVYGDGGYNNHTTKYAVDGINDADNNSAFISATEEDDWLRVDVGESVLVSKVDITAYPQYKAVRIDNIPDWCVVMASNDECEYNEQFTNYVVLEGENGIYTLPDEYKDTKFRYFEIEKPKRSGELDALIVREFTVYTDAKSLVEDSAANKPIIVDGEAIYDNALTDDSLKTKANYTTPVIDLLTPSLIGNIGIEGEDTDDIKCYGSLEYTDISSATEITADSTERYRYIYIDNSAETDIAKVKVNTYLSAVLNNWRYDADSGIYSIEFINGDTVAGHHFSAMVSQLDEDGLVISTDSESVDLEAGESYSFKFEPVYASNVSKTVCNIFQDNYIALTTPTIFDDGAIVNTYQRLDGGVTEDKDLVLCVDSDDTPIGIKIITHKEGYLDTSDVYSVMLYSTDGELLSYQSSNYTDEEGSFTCVVPYGLESGAYTATVILTDASLKSYYKEYRFNYTIPTDDDVSACIDAFKSSDGSDFDTLYNQYYVNKRVIDFSGLPILKDATVRARTGDAFVWARDNMSKWSSSTDIKTLDDIIACVKTAIIMQSVKDGSLCTALRLYSTTMSKIFIEDYDVIGKLYNFKDSDFDKILTDFILCNALAGIKDKTVTEIVSALEKYDSVFGISVSNIKKQGVDIYEVAKRIDNTIPDSYYDGLSKEVTAIVDKLKANTKKASSGGGGGGGSGSGGGGSSSTASSVSLLPKTTSDVSNDSRLDDGNDALTPSAVYTDIDSNYWAKEYIDTLSDAGIVKGLGDGMFEPERSVSRAEFVKMIVLAFGVTTAPGKSACFSDCSMEDWFYPYIDAAYTNSIVTGVSATEFQPNAVLNRQDAAVIMDNVLVKLDTRMRTPPALEFGDLIEISEYAVDAVKALVSVGVINGYDDDTFKPAKQLTRSEACALIVNMLTFTKGGNN